VAKINIIGVGPGSPDYVTPIARKKVQKAQLVIGAERALDLFKGDINGEELKLTARNLNDALARAVEAAKAGKSVALLSTGDPGFSGLLKTFLKAYKGENAEVDVTAGVSSIQVCAARLQMYWDEAKLFSFHDGIDARKKAEFADAIVKGEDIMLLPDPKDFSPSDVAKFLIGKGVAEDTSAVVCENLTLEDERVVASTLRGIVGKSYGSLCVMVIRPKCNVKPEQQ
jgi:cobalt-precorrin-7 (C5)-methyltransferase